MQLPELGVLKEYIAIPKVFHSFATGKPFERCIVCEKKLQEDGTQYIIEKSFRQYQGYGVSDVIYEYAMCIHCTVAMQQALSEDSLAVIDNYLKSRVNLVERRKHLLNKYRTNINGWLSTCLISGKPASESAEYQIYGHCDGGDLLFTYLPYMISADALEDLNDLISPETRDVLNDFIDNHFGLPPQYKELIKSRKSVII
jgi:hypothetical protein